MIDPTIRPLDCANDVEVEQVHDLEREARSTLTDRRGGPRWLEDNPAIGSGWADECSASIVRVAYIDEVIVGYIRARIGDDRIVRVFDVYITPEAREVGFGDELLHEVIATGRRLDARAIEGFALPGDRHTKNLYERAGIVARLITTYRPL
ncbi:MAG: GNAT family N-acetyltransferase [Acidimicrobiia bacterium]|nr:GNAT family N-acetyltransferase [Acidimicrobiia bacterium]